MKSRNVKSKWRHSFWPLALLLLAPAAAQDDANDEPEPQSASDQIEVVASLTGVFEAVTSTEIRSGNEELTELEISRVIPHGTSVKKGQPIVWFETEPMEDKLRNAEIDLKLARLANESEEFGYKQFLATNAMDKAAAKRTRDHAQSDYDYFAKTELERQIESAKQNLISSEFSVDSAREEYEQLKQMYEEDDLTEESEEIVLRRAKRALDSALFRLEGSKLSHKRSLDVTIPRTEISRRETLDRAIMTYDKTMHDLENQRRKRAIEIEKSRRAFKEKTEQFETLRKERSRVVLKAPHDGIVLHGVLTRGKLSSKPSTLKKGSKVTAEQVILTLAQPGKLRVHLDVPEAELAHIHVGCKTNIKPNGVENVTFHGTVKSVSRVPYVAGQFDCVVAVGGKSNAAVLPTMTCKVEFLACPEKEDK